MLSLVTDRARNVEWVSWLGTHDEVTVCFPNRAAHLVFSRTLRDSNEKMCWVIRCLIEITMFAFDEAEARRNLNSIRRGEDRGNAPLIRLAWRWLALARFDSRKKKTKRLSAAIKSAFLWVPLEFVCLFGIYDRAAAANFSRRVKVSLKWTSRTENKNAFNAFSLRTTDMEIVVSFLEFTIEIFSALSWARLGISIPQCWVSLKTNKVGDKSHCISTCTARHSLDKSEGKGQKCV